MTGMFTVAAGELARTWRAAMWLWCIYIRMKCRPRHMRLSSLVTDWPRPRRWSDTHRPFPVFSRLQGGLASEGANSDTRRCLSQSALKSLRLEYKHNYNGTRASVSCLVEKVRQGTALPETKGAFWFVCVWFSISCKAAALSPLVSVKYSLLLLVIVHWAPQDCGCPVAPSWFTFSLTPRSLS